MIAIQSYDQKKQQPGFLKTMLIILENTTTEHENIKNQFFKEIYIKKNKPTI